MEMKLKSNINIRWKTSVKISNVALAINRIEYMYVEVLKLFVFLPNLYTLKHFTNNELNISWQQQWS